MHNPRARISRLARRGGALLGRPAKSAAGRVLGVITSVATEERVAALTFDDGPHPAHTPALLALLARRRARATFFMVGELAQRHPDIVSAVAGAGHAIGNHTWSHLSLPLLSAAELERQIAAGRAALAPHGAPLLRPPYCHLTLRNSWALRRAGYQIVGFSVHAEDWLARDAEWMARQLVKKIRPGAIVILHDNIYRSVLPEAQTDRRPMLEALRRTLEDLAGRFEFVTVPELLRRGRPVREVWRRRGDAQMQAALRRYAQAPNPSLQSAGDPRFDSSEEPFRKQIS